jgi:hypothetical protein
MKICGYEASLVVSGSHNPEGDEGSNMRAMLHPDNLVQTLPMLAPRRFLAGSHPMDHADLDISD